MKKHVLNFIQRGFVGATFGPIILAIVYGILGAVGVTEFLSVGEVVLGIISITLMAFVAAGITAIYGSDRLPLAFAGLIHALVLYLDHIMIYLLNGWLADGLIPFLIFTAIFFLGFVIIWMIIYLHIKSKTKRLNEKLSK